MECSPASTRRTMSRRVRSESAWNHASARSSSFSVTSPTYNQMVVDCQEVGPQLFLGTSVEPDVAVGHAFGRPRGVVDPVVVMAAEQDAVRDVGRASAAPGGPVVGLGPGAGDVAACCAAGLVAQQ